VPHDLLLQVERRADDRDRVLVQVAAVRGEVRVDLDELLELCDEVRLERATVR
jgi:hypothetical protein